ncbi:MAG TPA: NYN domain-containing protein [Terriglobia bacterium]|nr:NYN domain-containing protein [Terriglobia bacterium]
MSEERLKLAVFIDFDNIQIGVKDTLGKEFDVELVLEALKERGEVVTKIAYGDWHRAGEQSRSMTQHAVQLVQRNVTPRGDKNGADINLALDALEMAFTRHHITAFAIVGGDSDFIALVEKLKQYDKRIFVVGGRSFTSNILQRNCHEFIAYENLQKPGEGGRRPRSARESGRRVPDGRPLSAAYPNVQRALKIIAEREVSPQIGLLKSTLLQLDPTFSERDYGAGSFLEFIQKMAQENLVGLRRVDRGYLVDLTEAIAEKDSTSAAPQTESPASPAPPAAVEPAPSAADEAAQRAEALEILKNVLAAAAAKAPNRPLYMRHIRQGLKAAGHDFEERRLGFRGTLDLLHSAERAGLLRLTRDRNGALRIFPTSAVTSTAIPAEMVPGGAAEATTSPEMSGAAEASGQAVESIEPPTSLAEVVEAGAVEETQPEAAEAPKKRRGRPSRGKSSQRKATPRRKPKESQEGE